MKPVFPDDMARELGYQKYHTELSDWIMYITFSLLFTAGFGAILYLFIK